MSDIVQTIFELCQKPYGDSWGEDVKNRTKDRKNRRVGYIWRLRQPSLSSIVSLPMKTLLVSIPSFIVTGPYRLRETKSNEDSARRMPFRTVSVNTASEMSQSDSKSEKHDI
jgi:hypothetical protein